MSKDIRRIDSIDIPQADNLSNIRAIVRAIASGVTSVEEISTKTGIKIRHVSYGLSAARTLGLLTRSNECATSTLGRALLDTTVGSVEERKTFQLAIDESPILSAIVPNLFAADAPTKKQLASRIEKISTLSENTAERRAQTLLSWRSQLMDPQPLLLDLGPHEASSFPMAGSSGRDSSAQKDSASRQQNNPLQSVADKLHRQQLSMSVMTPIVQLSEDLIRDIQRDNPWWAGRPSKPLPPVRRNFVADIQKRLRQGLAPIIVVRGPRQVGKTTAQFQVIADLLEAGTLPANILRVQCDDLPAMAKLEEPILRIVEWYEASILKKTLNEAAHAGEPTYLFFDEVQNLSDWAVQLKHLVDGSKTQVIVTGSSALRIEQGRDSLAGRINSIEVGTLTLNEIAAIRFGDKIKRPMPEAAGLERLASKDFWHEVRDNGRAQAEMRARAFAAFSERGGYPLVHDKGDVPWAYVADQLNETVIKRVIQHDLRIGDRGRKRDAALLEEVFRLGCRYAGQAPNLDVFAREAQRALMANVGIQRIRHYLDFLDRTLLLRLVQPLEIRLKRTRGAAKLCLADHGLRASWLQEVIPLDPVELAKSPHLSDLAGRIAESVVGAYLFTIGGLDLAHFPERSGEPEVDFVITAGAHRIPVEVKYRRHVQPMNDTEGLRSFIEHKAYNAPFGLLITQGEEDPVEDPRIVTLPLSSVLLMH